MEPDSLSRKNIFVNIASDISIADIEGWLGVEKVLTANAKTLGLAEGDLHIGYVQVLIGPPISSLNAGQKMPAERQWNASITFRPLRSEWVDCAIHVGLEVCEQIHSERGGCFLGADDDGVLFFIGEGGLTFNERYRSYFSCYPHGFDGAVVFENLLAV